MRYFGNINPLTVDGFSCTQLGSNLPQSYSKHNKTVLMDQHVEELKRSKEKDNLIVILLLGSIAGCALVLLSVRIQRQLTLHIRESI